MCDIEKCWINVCHKYLSKFLLISKLSAIHFFDNCLYNERSFSELSKRLERTNQLDESEKKMKKKPSRSSNNNNRTVSFRLLQCVLLRVWHCDLHANRGGVSSWQLDEARILPDGRIPFLCALGIFHACIFNLSICSCPKNRMSLSLETNKMQISIKEEYSEYLYGTFSIRLFRDTGSVWRLSIISGYMVHTTRSQEPRYLGWLMSTFTF